MNVLRCFALLSIVAWMMLLPMVQARSPLAQRHLETLQRDYSQTNRWEALDPVDVREYVLPLTSLGEEEVDWLPVLRPLAHELTQNAQTPLEAAMVLNRYLWKRIGVIYSTKREKANQDPLHSIRLGLASCSGLSILLVDACRSLGIPARVVGCLWRHKPGNHSWVEVKSNGQWYPLGAFEDCPPDQLWFLDDAAQADAGSARYAIYAACATPGNAVFYGWGVPAENVTQHYVKAHTSAQASIRIYYAAERNGERVSVPFRVNGHAYTTPGPLQDLNDYTVIELSEVAPFEVEMEGNRYRYECQPGAIIVEQLP